MIPERSPSMVWSPVAMALVVALGGMTFTWVHVTKLGGFDLTVAYVAVILLGGSLLLRPYDTMLSAVSLARNVLPWLILYLCYLLVLAAHLAGFPDKGMLLRQIFFLLCGITTGLALLQSDDPARTLRRGGLAALAGFLLYSELLARQNGLSWLTTIQVFVTQGDLDYVVYKFLRVLFRAAGDGDAEIAASVKNIVAASLFVVLCIFRAGHPTILRDRWGQVMTLVVLGLMVLFNTRSVLVVTVLAMIVVFIISSIRVPRHSGAGLVLKGIVAVFLITAMVLLLSSDQAATAQIGERFSFADASTEGRLQQVGFALAGIEQSILFGSGLAEINGQLVHNLFLGAWLHGGLVAFLTIIVAYTMIVAVWVRFVAQIAFRRASWVLPVRPEWIDALPLLPLFRVWIAGDAGHPGFPEWMALFLFFAVLTMNQQAIRPRARLQLYRAGEATVP